MSDDSKQSAPVVYRDVPDFPGYRMGSDGRPWSAWVNRGAGGSFIGREWKPLRIQQPKSKKAYPQVTLRKERKSHRFSLHRLVCEIFHGPCPPGHEAAHENGIRTDCRADNLKWKTRLENHADKKRHGTNRGGASCGERNGSAKLTDSQVSEIRQRRAAGEGPTALGIEFKIHRCYVYELCSGDARANGTGVIQTATHVKQ